MSIMATASNVVDVNLQKLTGCFDVDSVPSYNLLNLGRFVVNSFENTFNFCCELKLLNTNRTCGRCRRALKLSLDRQDDHATPVRPTSRIFLLYSPADRLFRRIFG